MLGVGATLTWGGGAAFPGELVAAALFDELELLSAKAATIPPPRRSGMANSSQMAEPCRRPRPRTACAGGA